MNEWNDIAVIAPTQDIDIATVPFLRDQIDGLVRSGVRRIMVNCEDVRFIDSTGLAFLISSARRLRARGGLLSLRNVSPQLMRFFQISRLVDALHVSSAEKPAIPSLATDEEPLWTRSFEVRPGIENLASYRHRVSELFAGLPMSREVCFDMALAVGEALSNAYDHADGAAGASFTVQAYADRVVIEVLDCGCGFELGPDEDPPRVSEARGRGIRLMRMLADSVEVRRRSGGVGTSVRLVKLYGSAE